MADVEAIKEVVKTALDGAFYEYDVDSDGDFYVKSGMDLPFWVSVNSPKFIIIHSYLSLKTDIDDIENKAIALAHRITTKKMPNMVFVMDGKIRSFYYLPCMGGVTPRHVIEMLRICSEGFVSGVREYDTDDIVS